MLTKAYSDQQQFIGRRHCRNFILGYLICLALFLEQCISVHTWAILYLIYNEAIWWIIWNSIILSWIFTKQFRNAVGNLMNLRETTHWHCCRVHCCKIYFSMKGRLYITFSKTKLKSSSGKNPSYFTVCGVRFASNSITTAVLPGQLF